MALATALPVAPLPSRTSAPSQAVRPARPRRPKLGPVGHSHHPGGVGDSVRLTQRGVVLCWVAALATVMVTVFGLSQAFQPAAPAVVGSTTVSVLPGQSLWTVAEQVNPSVDPRVSVNAIREANGLSSTSVIQPGMRLSVPVYAGQP